jgi:hypothetical protein
MGSLLHTDIDGFIKDLVGINRYMTVDESIVTVGINGINGIGGKVESQRQSVKGTT